MTLENLFRRLVASSQASISIHLIVILLYSSNILTPNLNQKVEIESRIKLVSHLIKFSTNSRVLLRNSREFNNARVVHNGLCKNIIPNIIVIPTSTKDVSRIVRVVRIFKIPISIRSGGHSYICSNIKQDGVHIDLRKMDKVDLIDTLPSNMSESVVILGPGSTWARVLEYVPTNKYTLIHGQCLGVGVGGFLLGGGINAIGTSQRYKTGASNVLQYTMVDSEGDIYKISASNVTKMNRQTGRFETSPKNHDIFKSLQLAGSSFGITTEFIYRVYNRPEVRPTLVLIYIDDEVDLYNFELAAFDGRYHVSIHVPYYFTPLNWHARERDFETAFRIFFKIYPYLQYRTRRPVLMAVVDNFPSINQTTTDEKSVYSFLEEYKIKIAMKGGMVADLLQSPNILSQLQNYEISYRTSDQMKQSGPRPLVSANFMNLTNISSVEDILLHHPLFGLQKLDGGSEPMDHECEYCFLSLVTANKKLFQLGSDDFVNTDANPIDHGKIQMEMTCLYEPGIKSRCPQIVRDAKVELNSAALRNGERLTQYSNTPSCDTNEEHWKRYWNPNNNKMLLNSKKMWDPYDIFNHCHSVGSIADDCCPKDA